MSETFIFSVAAGFVIVEFYDSGKKSAAKEAKLTAWREEVSSRMRTPTVSKDMHGTRLKRMEGGGGHVAYARTRHTHTHAHTHTHTRTRTHTHTHTHTQVEHRTQEIQTKLDELMASKAATEAELRAEIELMRAQQQAWSVHTTAAQSYSTLHSAASTAYDAASSVISGATRVGADVLVSL
jgi:hypothetical protein